MPLNIIRVLDGANTANCDASGTGNVDSCIISWIPYVESDTVANCEPGTWTFEISVTDNSPSEYKTGDGHISMLSATDDTLVGSFGYFNTVGNTFYLWDIDSNEVANGTGGVTGNVSVTYCHVCPVKFRLVWSSSCYPPGGNSEYNVSVYANGTRSAGCT